MRNIIITGGELFNKGAQAMTFIAVDELKKRFPKHEILVLSPMDLKRPKSELEQYNFKLIDVYPPVFARCQHNPFLRLLYFVRHNKELKEAEEIYRNADALIDISGYALGANWDFSCCDLFLKHIEFAQAFRISVYLMPQSFGPFPLSDKKLNQRCKRALSKVQVICAREQEGVAALEKAYGLHNVCKKPDLVLNNKAIDYKAVFNVLPTLSLPTIKSNSVAVIPNGMTRKVRSEKEIINTYCDSISQLRELGKTVYLMYHATSDSELAAKLKSCFFQDDQVVLFDKDFSCIEFNEMAKQFDYLVASRYHSIVHAYKNGTPCVVLGWATKYNALLEMFGQGKYMFDIRNGVNIENLKAAIIEMNRNYSVESDRIKKQQKWVQKENVFDIISLS